MADTTSSSSPKGKSTPKAEPQETSDDPSRIDTPAAQPVAGVPAADAGAPVSADEAALTGRPLVKDVVPVSGAKPITKGKLTEFIWRGPVEGLELTHEGKVVWAGTLMPGRSVKLPAEHTRVQQLVARKLLVAPPKDTPAEQEA